MCSLNNFIYMRVHCIFCMLPEDLLISLSCVALHDAKIIKLDVSGEKIRVEFDSDNNGALRKVFLEYWSAKVLKRPSYSVLGGDIEIPNSDVMCHEIEFVEKEGFLHSILFASNEELIVSFKSMLLNYKDYA